MPTIVDVAKGALADGVLRVAKTLLLNPPKSHTEIEYFVDRLLLDKSNSRNKQTWMKFDKQTPQLVEQNGKIYLRGIDLPDIEVIPFWCIQYSIFWPEGKLAFQHPCENFSWFKRIKTNSRSADLLFKLDSFTPTLFEYYNGCDVIEEFQKCNSFKLVQFLN